MNPLEPLIRELAWASTRMYPSRYKHRNRSPETLRKAQEKRERRADNRLALVEYYGKYIHGPK